ncbi:MAG: hypothetical protein ACRCWG_09490 [Sarcina sp.]
MMGIKSFSRQMFSKTIKDSFSYICTVAITAMLVFVTVNISFNELIYGNNTSELINVYKLMGRAMVEVQIPLGYIQKELILITILIVGVFTVISNNTFLKKRINELAFIVMNGATTTEMSYYIRYMCSKMFVIASMIGLVLGIIFAPVFNLIMYNIVGIEGQVFLYYSETFVIVISFILVNYLYLMIASTAYVYRKEVDELMSDNREKTSKDTRMIKFPSIIYLILYICPLFILILPKAYGDISGFVTVGVYISVLASIGVITMYIPRKLRTINNMAFMNHKERKIYINNAFIKLKNTIIYIAGMVISVNYFLSKILEFREHKDIVTILLFSMVICSVIIAVTLTNKIIEDCGINKKFYKDLSAMGYNKNELFKISLKENKTIILAIIFFVAVPIIFAVLMHIKNRSIAKEMLILIGGATVIPILISGLISYITNQEKVYEILELETKKILPLKWIGSLLTRSVEKLLVIMFNVSDESTTLWKRKLIWKVRLVHIFIVGAFIVVIPSFLMGYISSNFKKEMLDMPVIGEENKKLDSLLNLYTSIPKGMQNGGQAYYYKGITEYDYISDKIYYTNESGYGSATNIQLDEKDKKVKSAIENHKMGMQESEKNSDYYMKNAFALISLYYQNGETAKAFEVIEELKVATDKKVVSYGLFNEGLLNLKMNEYDKAIEAFEKVNTEYIMVNEYIVQAYRMKGDYNKESEYRLRLNDKRGYQAKWEQRANQKGYGVYDINFDLRDEIDVHPHPELLAEMGYSASLKENKNGVEANLKVKEVYKENILGEKYRGSIKGGFDVADASLEGIEVVLTTTPRNHDQLAGISISNDTEVYTAYIQSDGTFEFNNIINGKYYINFVIPQSQFVSLGIKNTEFENEIVINSKEEKNLLISKKDDGLITNEKIEEGKMSGNELLGSYKSEGNKVVFEVGKGDRPLPDVMVDDRVFDKKVKEIEFYKVFGDYRIGSIASSYRALGIKIDYTQELFAKELPKDEAKPIYDGEITRYINSGELEVAMDKCIEIYENDKTDEDALTLLIKFYVTGVDITGKGKNIEKALELSDELYRLHQNEDLDKQVKEYIYLNKYTVFTTR